MIAIKINTNFVNYSVIIFPQTYEINIVLIFIENFRNTKTATINATEQKKKSLITRTITIHVFYVLYGTI